MFMAATFAPRCARGNRFAQESRRLLLVARPGLADLPIRELLALTPERFAEVFRRTPIKRLKLVGLLRNACVVAGNSGDANLIEPLVRLASHASPLVRAHAVWAVFRLTGESPVPRPARALSSSNGQAGSYKKHARRKPMRPFWPNTTRRFSLRT